MRLFLFKGSNGDIELVNENVAHNWLRNKNAWQRQDMIYQGVVDDASIKKVQESIQEDSKNEVFMALPKVQLLRDSMELAVLQKNESEAKIKELELNVFRGNFNAIMADRSGNVMSDEHDQWRGLVMKKNNEILKKALEALQADKSVIPRNFDKLTSNFSGENVQLADNIPLQ